MREIEATSYLAVGRKYGVSDNAVRKWVRFYERQAAREAAEAARAVAVSEVEVAEVDAAAGADLKEAA